MYKKIPSTSLRPKFIYGLVITLSMVLGAFFFQYVMDIKPCPLCLFQRNIALLTSLIFLVALIHNPKDWTRRLYAFMAFISSLVGMIFSARHTWLHAQVDPHTSDCGGPGLDLLMDRLPTTVFIERVFNGTIDCIDTVTTFLQLPLPAWVFLLCTFLFVYSGLILIRNQ